MDPATWIKTIFDNFLAIIVVPVFFGVSIMVFIWAGFLFLTAQGDPAKILTSKKLVLYGVIGIVVAMLASGVPIIIAKILGLP